ncbi:SpoIIE family protein phosphatase [Allonocardiopsis opalescens]|uniref:PAS domain S-box-containing protein n=1 Tax=Allonocardiopsis opalescens TaxID=1144618 RepID=A0A2T0PWY4_9ACTN|nr:SpoIIE family protein phosphatase [Allonocardiopsis opalescens]PRX96042.1 PAS domain S-box-containing protein [Allonocardiopsis opalescens]
MGATVAALDVGFRYAPVALLRADHSGRIGSVNQALVELISGSSMAHAAEAGLIGRRWPHLVLAGDRAEGWQAHRDALDGTAPTERRLLRLQCGDDVRTVVASVRADGEPDGAEPGGDGVVVAFFDLAHGGEELGVLAELGVERSHTAVWALDIATGEFSQPLGSTGFGRFFGPGVRTWQDLLERVHPEDVEQLVAAAGAARRHGDFDHRFRVRDHRGDERWIQARGRTLGQPGRTRIVGVLDDVTEHAQLVRRLARRQRREADHSRQVTELAGALVSATTVAEISELVVARIASLFDGDGGVFGLLEDGRLRVTGYHGVDQSVLAALQGIEVAESRGPVSTALRRRAARFYESRAELLDAFPNLHEVFTRGKVQSCAIVPLSGSDRLPTGLWIFGWTRPHHCSHDERMLMYTLADLAGQALERVKLQQAQLDLSAALQRRMLPPDVPEVRGLDVAVRYLPSQAGFDICGDWYDVFTLPDGRIGLVVGDVQGHGVEAAAAMGQIRVAFRAYAAGHDDPGAVLAATNRLLSEAGEIVFATCGYLVLDPVTGIAHAAWAGQPPIVFADSQGMAVWGPETGPPVGVDPRAVYPVSQAWLEPGTVMLMCSDGLVENARLAMDDGLSMAGSVLAEWSGATADVIADALVGTAPAGRHDDIALLVARL